MQSHPWIKIKIHYRLRTICAIFMSSQKNKQLFFLCIRERNWTTALLLPTLTCHDWIYSYQWHRRFAFSPLLRLCSFLLLALLLCWIFHAHRATTPLIITASLPCCIFTLTDRYATLPSLQDRYASHVSLLLLFISVYYIRSSNRSYYCCCSTLSHQASPVGPHLVLGLYLIRPLLRAVC